MKCGYCENECELFEYLHRKPACPSCILQHSLRILRKYGHLHAYTDGIRITTLKGIGLGKVTAVKTNKFGRSRKGNRTTSVIKAEIGGIKCHGRFNPEECGHIRLIKKNNKNRRKK